MRAALAGADAVVNAASHRLNLPVMQACLEVGAHYTDLGGLYYFALEQYELDEAFRAAGLSAAISMGAAPGITNMLAAAAVAELDTVESIEVLDAVVAGRPYDPDEPYVPAYAADTLIDEFTRPAPMFIDGREQLMEAARRRPHLPPARGRRGVRVHDPLRAGHAPPLLRRPRHPHRRVAARACRPRTRCRCARSSRAGMASTDPVQVDGRDVRPRDVLVAVLARQGGAADDPEALERLRAHVVGARGGRRVEIDADLPLSQHAEWGTDSGTYSTGVPPSIAAQLLAGGQALRTGVGGPEVIIPVERVLRRPRDARHARRDRRPPPARLTYPAPARGRYPGSAGEVAEWLKAAPC